jgi:outer membrane protein
MRGLLTALAALLAISALTSLAAAEPARASASSSDWTVMIGVEGRVLPSYEGASNSMLRPFPMFDIRRAGTKASFRSPRDGFSFGILDVGRFQAGPTVKARFARNEGSDSNLRGLGDSGWTLEAGVFVEYWPTDWLRGRVELRQGIGGHHGLVSDLTADLVMPVTQQLTLSGGPRLTVASAAATNPYFSITPGQSAASGLPVYDAGGGLRSLGLGVQARYDWSPQWATHIFVEYDRLAGDAANSPLVVQRGSRDQIQVGIGASYSFDMRGLW